MLDIELEDTEWKGKVKLRMAYLALTCECCGHEAVHFVSQLHALGRLGADEPQPGPDSGQSSGV
jgi:hypothetical protein